MNSSRRGHAGAALGLAGSLIVGLLGACAYIPGGFPPAAPATAPDVQPHVTALDDGACRALVRDDAPAASLQQAAARTLDYVRQWPFADTKFFGRQLDASALGSALTAVMEAANGADWPQSICDRLRLYRVETVEPVLITGYYQPELGASRKRTERFRYPLYRTPDDLVDADLGQFCPACAGRVAHGRVQNGKLVPYYSRAEIESGALAGRGYEIAWLDDPVEAFFLHVQGSALLRYDDGVHMEVSYSGSNGLPYTSLGSALIAAGKMSRANVSLQTLKDYLRAHSEEQGALMSANQRYIFFRAVTAGPVGSLGVPLTEGRSVAADQKIYPPGALVFLRISARDPRQEQPLVSRFAVIQDAGTAITGPGRLDVFWGTGLTAEAIAGDMRNPGEVYLVLPK